MCYDITQTETEPEKEKNHTKINLVFIKPIEIGSKALSSLILKLKL